LSELTPIKQFEELTKLIDKINQAGKLVYSQKEYLIGYCIFLDLKKLSNELEIDDSKWRDLIFTSFGIDVSRVDRAELAQTFLNELNSKYKKHKYCKKIRSILFVPQKISGLAEKQQYQQFNQQLNELSRKLEEIKKEFLDSFDVDKAYSKMRVALVSFRENEGLDVSIRGQLEAIVDEQFYQYAESMGDEQIKITERLSWDEAKIIAINAAKLFRHSRSKLYKEHQEIKKFFKTLTFFVTPKTGSKNSIISDKAKLAFLTKVLFFIEKVATSVLNTQEGFAIDLPTMNYYLYPTNNSVNVVSEYLIKKDNRVVGKLRIVVNVNAEGELTIIDATALELTEMHCLSQEFVGASYFSLKESPERTFAAAAECINYMLHVSSKGKLLDDDFETSGRGSRLGDYFAQDKFDGIQIGNMPAQLQTNLFLNKLLHDQKFDFNKCFDEALEPLVKQYLELAEKQGLKRAIEVMLPKFNELTVKYAITFRKMFPRYWQQWLSLYEQKFGKENELGKKKLLTALVQFFSQKLGERISKLSTLGKKDYRCSRVMNILSKIEAYNVEEGNEVFFGILKEEFNSCFGSSDCFVGNLLVGFESFIKENKIKENESKKDLFKSFYSVEKYKNFFRSYIYQGDAAFYNIAAQEVNTDIKNLLDNLDKLTENKVIKLIHYISLAVFNNLPHYFKKLKDRIKSFFEKDLPTLEKRKVLNKIAREQLAKISLRLPYLELKMFGQFLQNYFGKDSKVKRHIAILTSVAEFCTNKLLNSTNLIGRKIFTEKDIAKILLNPLLIHCYAPRQSVAYSAFKILNIIRHTFSAIANNLESPDVTENLLAALRAVMVVENSSRLGVSFGSPKISAAIKDLQDYNGDARFSSELGLSILQNERILTAHQYGYPSIDWQTKTDVEKNKGDKRFKLTERQSRLQKQFQRENQIYLPADTASIIKIGSADLAQRVSYFNSKNNLMKFQEIDYPDQDPFDKIMANFHAIVDNTVKYLLMNSYDGSHRFTPEMIDNILKHPDKFAAVKLHKKNVASAFMILNIICQLYAFLQQDDVDIKIKKNNIRAAAHVLQQHMDGLEDFTSVGGSRLRRALHQQYAPLEKINEFVIVSRLSGQFTNELGDRIANTEYQFLKHQLGGRDFKYQSRSSNDAPAANTTSGHKSIKEKRRHEFCKRYAEHYQGVSEQPNLDKAPEIKIPSEIKHEVAADAKEEYLFKIRCQLPPLGLNENTPSNLVAFWDRRHSNSSDKSDKEITNDKSVGNLGVSEEKAKMCSINEYPLLVG
jgi:hypothetical protein